MKKYNKNIILTYEEALNQESEVNLEEVFDHVFNKMIKVDRRWRDFISSSFNLKQYQFAYKKKSEFIKFIDSWLYSE